MGHGHTSTSSPRYKNTWRQGDSTSLFRLGAPGSTRIHVELNRTRSERPSPIGGKGQEPDPTQTDATRRASDDEVHYGPARPRARLRLRKADLLPP